MFCSKCGAELKEGVNFCHICGTRISKSPVDVISTSESKFRTDEKMILEGEGNDGKRIKIIAGSIAFAVIVSCVLGIVAYLNSQKDAAYDAKIEEANQYLQKLDYEKAETAYLDAIDIEPKRIEPYLELADVYVVQEEFDAALDILQEGKKKTRDEKTFIKKIEKVTKQSEADSETVQYQAYYEIALEYQDKYGEAGYLQWKDEDGFGYLTGLCIVKLFDFNKDGNEELIVGYQEQNQDPRDEVPHGDYKYEIWAWQNGEMVNILPATNMNCGTGVGWWINTAVKNGAVFLEVDSWDYSGSTPYIFHQKYLQYEDGKFTEKYTYSGTEFDQPAQFAVNDTIVYSHEEARRLMEDFPKIRSDTYASNSAFIENDNGEMCMDVIGEHARMQAILSETERNLTFLKLAETEEQGQALNGEVIPSNADGKAIRVKDGDHIAITGILGKTVRGNRS